MEVGNRGALPQYIVMSEEDHATSDLGVDDEPADIRSWHLPNTKLERSSYT